MRRRRIVTAAFALLFGAAACGGGGGGGTTTATTGQLPALVTIALLQFIEGWNAFLWPLIVTATDRVRPLQVGLAAFSFTDSTRPELLAAGAFMTTLPILVVFLVAQRQLVGGIASTGIRG